MLERRKEPRARMSVRVTLSGHDARCEVFSEMVLATSLSRSGALLNQVLADLRCGDLVMVEHDGQSSRFRIVWMLSSRGSPGAQVAIHKLDNQVCPWESLLPVESEVSFTN